MLIEMTIKGLMVDPITNMPIVMLKDTGGDRVLPIWVGIFEANAIALQIENIATPRPMTHDLLRNVIKDLDGTVERVVVCDLRDNTFYAVIYLTVRGESVAIDARPSDAIALALRTRSPILVEERVIDNARNLDFSSEEMAGGARPGRSGEVQDVSRAGMCTRRPPRVGRPTIAAVVPARNPSRATAQRRCGRVRAKSQTAFQVQIPDRARESPGRIVHNGRTAPR
jgi:bifunctional DNase/RNase